MRSHDSMPVAAVRTRHESATGRGKHARQCSTWCAARVRTSRMRTGGNVSNHSIAADFSWIVTASCPAADAARAESRLVVSYSKSLLICSDSPFSFAMQRRRFSCVCGGYDSYEALAFSVLDETRVQGVFVRPTYYTHFGRLCSIQLYRHST